MSRQNYKGWILASALVLSLLLLADQLRSKIVRNIEIAYARKTFFNLQKHRDSALGADVSEATKRLLWVSEGTNTKQSPGSPLDEMCTAQRTNMVRDIIVYLRAKTGENLGEKPQPWIEKYGPKH